MRFIERDREIGLFLLPKIRKEGDGWLDGSNNSFFVDKTPMTLEALKILASRVLFMTEDNEQNNGMNKTVLFKNQRIRRRCGRMVLFIFGWKECDRRGVRCCSLGGSTPPS